jgi:type II secretory pathway pseudopilin PulG
MDLASIISAMIRISASPGQRVNVAGIVSDQRGITVIEILFAAAIISIGLAGLLSVVPMATYGVQDGNQVSTATFLAQQRLELVRAATWDGATDCVGLSATPTSPPVPSPAGTCPAGAGATFPDEGAGALPGFGQYARTVRITDCGVAGNVAACGNVTNPALRLVTVTVTYRPISAAGQSSVNTSVRLEWIVTRRS